MTDSGVDEPKREEAVVRFPRPTLSHRPPRAAGSVVLAAVAMLAVLSACAVPASTPTAPGTPSESALIHRLTACLAPGQAKPTVVLVHGAWADTSSWRGETGTLQAAGYDVRAIANPLQNLTADSRYVRDYLQALRGPVVLAGHSYGGSVITNAAAGLANVKALVYVDAIAPAPGETTAQLSGAGPLSPGRSRPSCTSPPAIRVLPAARPSCT